MNRPSSPSPSFRRSEAPHKEASEVGVYTLSDDDTRAARGIFNGFLLALAMWCLMIAGGSFAWTVITTIWSWLT